MELRHLRYFVAVAEAENVSRAALKLHVSQPGISRQIRDLEDEIGFSLLERSAKSVRLTAAGKVFLHEAREVLSRVEAAVNKAREVAKGGSGEIRVGKQWYCIDLLLFHRRLRCLFIFDLKLGRFTHADAGQMNLYVNYAAEHLTLDGENPPVGLILCSEHDEAVARYSMGNVTNKILAAQYKLALPDPRLIEKEIEKTRRMLELRAKLGYKFPTAKTKPSRKWREGI